MPTMRFALGVSLTLVLLLTAETAATRDHVLAVGSSTVYPFATTAAERIGRRTRFKTPQIEAWGSGGGIQLFCRGVGAEEADIAFSSREITTSEREQCNQNGVTDILELRLGWDGIIFATAGAGPHLDLTLGDIYLALGREIPNPTGEATFVRNPYRRWSDISGTLPDVPIQVYGPPITSGTRDILIERALIAGCRTLAWLNELQRSDPKAFRQGCGAIREDGIYVSTGENDNLIVRKIAVSDHAVGIVGFSYYDQNRDKLQASEVEGVEPSYESIYDRRYALARPLFLYVKDAHLSSIPGLLPFVQEIVSQRAAGEEGYLVEQGLIPLPEAEREANARRVTKRAAEHR
ncbi:MAG: substrate-binding domain-containing protein [Chromatiaceae bacterium]|nr:substrate-binding domain-containing protein [Chromatiaceae bacterium]